MNRLISRSGAARLALAALLLMGSTSFAAAQERVRGQVTAIDGDIATVQTTAGDSVEVAMAPDFAMMVYTPISIDDVKPGDYLSIPSITSADGAKQALSINVFPAELKGVGEGEHAWDLGEDSKMTNATVGTVASVGADHTIAVTYGGVEETVLVPEATPITSFGPDPDRTLAVGDNAVFFGAETDGKFSAARAGVTADGLIPPV